jgi:zona occludens toxin
MFTLVTGTPGASKTSNVIAKLLKETERPIFYRGIRDLQLPWKELTDEETKNWPEHLPDGAILVVDEAQQIWPQKRFTKEVPSGLTALETHRHRGWDVYFITQDPGLLDPHARKIANEHFHYVRPFGAPMVVEYHSGTGSITPSTRTDLKRCVQKKKPLPKEAWGYYKSAEIHTHKFRPPKILFIMLAALLIAPLSWWAYFERLSSKGEEARAVAPVANQAGQAGNVAQAAPVDQAKKSWKELLKPEIEGLPWTAPLYDDIARKPTVVPMLSGCRVRQKDLKDCECYTQQGTVVSGVSWQMCLKVIEGGMFNHLAAAGAERSSDAEARSTPTASVEHAGGPTVVSITYTPQPRITPSS